MSNEQKIPIAGLSALAQGDIENFFVAATPGGIEAQEAAGQTALVHSDVLPREFNYCKKEDFEALGFEFGEPVDNLFQKATLPPGWKKVASEHSMWSYIVDETGRKRVAVFYKAAFYDRRAFMGIEKIEDEQVHKEK